MVMERRGEILFYSVAGGVVMGARESITRPLMMMALRYSARCPDSCSCAGSIEQGRAWAWAWAWTGSYAGRSAMM